MGSGGVGGFYGGRLAHTGCDVTFVARGAHLAAMRSHGLLIESEAQGNIHVKAVKVTDDPASTGIAAGSGVMQAERARKSSTFPSGRVFNVFFGRYVVGIETLEVAGSFAWGVAVSHFFSDHLGLEASWAQQGSDLVMFAAPHNQG